MFHLQLERNTQAFCAVLLLNIKLYLHQQILKNSLKCIIFFLHVHTFNFLFKFLYLYDTSV